MTDANYKGLHEYYKDRDFKPTFASFKSAEELDRYAAARLSIYRNLLHLPPRMFEGARVCEFGPDTGENALVFARWGARMTLVEPRPAAWQDIRAYFQRYGLADKLEAIIGETVEDFRSDTRFDFLNAEGFIYTVQPTEMWLKKFAELLNPGGLAVANYLDQAGCLFELLWALCHARYQEVSGERGVDAAWSLFEPKWNSIQHTRPFESWVKDVLENPFVRLTYLIDPAELSAKAFAQGLAMQASWPRYEDPFDPFWHKRIPAERVLEERRRAFIARSRLSFAFARPLFTVGSDVRTASINKAVLGLVASVDTMIDGWDGGVAARARGQAAELDEALAGPDLMAEPSERAAARASLAALTRTLELLDRGEASAIRQQMRTHEILMGTWGATTHYAVFRLMEGDR